MQKIESADREIEALEYIYRQQNAIKQRDLAKIIGVSLGMTNAILKRLARKGWLMIQRVNNRNIQYVVSPAGIEVIAKKSYRYLKHTIKNVVLYKEAISKFIVNIKSQGYKKVVLVGSSDIDFILDHQCAKHNMAYDKGERVSSENDRFFLYSEGYAENLKNAPRDNQRNFDYLSNILMNLEG